MTALINLSALSFFLVSFSFIDERRLDGALIETNGSTNYSISCLTDDPNANTTLLFNQNTVRVGGRITLHLQTYVIHGLTLKDQGTYMCKAFRNQGGAPITKTLVLFLRKGIPNLALNLAFFRQGFQNYAWM